SPRLFARRLYEPCGARFPWQIGVAEIKSTIDIPPASPDIVEEDTLKLDAAFNPRDPVESLLTRQLVAPGNASMGCFRRASCKSGPATLNLRHTLTLLEAIKMLDARRGEIK